MYLCFYILELVKKTYSMLENKLRVEYLLIISLLLSMLPLYNQIQYYDLFAHALVIGTMTAVLLKHVENTMLVPTTVVWVMLLWEFFEYYYNNIIYLQFITGYLDTLFDLLIGLASMTVCIVLENRVRT